MGPKVANCRGYLNNGLSHTGSKNGGSFSYDEIGILARFADKKSILLRPLIFTRKLAKFENFLMKMRGPPLILAFFGPQNRPKSMVAWPKWPPDPPGSRGAQNGPKWPFLAILANFEDLSKITVYHHFYVPHGKFFFIF